MIRAVLFDLDGTLYDRDALVVKVAHDQFAAFRSKLGDVSEDAFVHRLLAIDDHGYASRPDLYRDLAAHFALGPGLGTELENQFWNCYSQGCTLSDDTWTTLQTLRTAGKRLGVITNGQTAWQSRKLESLGLGAFFDVVLISEAEGLRKPDPRIFASALDRCGVSPGDAVFVGDHPEVDVAGARAAGLVPVWKRVPYWTLELDGVLVVDRLSEILPVCLQA
jgi:putative hydrolase of the HAD superfamily